MTFLFESLSDVVQTIHLKDCVDILIIAFIFYHGFRLMRNTRAEMLVRGIILLVVMTQVALWLDLTMVKFILQNMLQVGLVAILILFQPELRRALEQIGRSKFGMLFGSDGLTGTEETQLVIDAIGKAVESMSKNRIGALIVVERATKVSDIVRTGIEMHSDISAELLVNIFVPNTPLHDGAVIVREGKILAAACFLPLTSNNELSYELGTRHRAAIGMSETSDALVVVVSEETGKISLALEGALTRNLTVDSLKKAMNKILTPKEPSANKKVLFRRGKKDA